MTDDAAARAREVARACLEEMNPINYDGRNYESWVDIITAHVATFAASEASGQLEVTERVRATAQQWEDRYHAEVHETTRLRGLLETARQEAEEARREIYAPGHWRCAVCGFYNLRSTLNAHTGTVGVGSPADVCPNDGALMQPVKWSEIAEDQRQASSTCHTGFGA